VGGWKKTPTIFREFGLPEKTVQGPKDPLQGNLLKEERHSRSRGDSKGVLMGRSGCLSRGTRVYRRKKTSINWVKETPDLQG